MGVVIWHVALAFPLVDVVEGLVANGCGDGHRDAVDLTRVLVDEIGGGHVREVLRAVHGDLMGCNGVGRSGI